MTGKEPELRKSSWLRSPKTTLPRASRLRGCVDSRDLCREFLRTVPPMAGDCRRDGEKKSPEERKSKVMQAIGKMEAGRTIEMRLFSVSNRMKQVCLGLYFVLGLSLGLGWAQVPRQASPRVDVVIGGDAPALERFAASELCDYLAKLYRVDAFPERQLSPSPSAIFLIGNPDTNALVKQASETKPFPKVSDQGIVLRRTLLNGRPALIVGGGSPRATLWAVYELVERWGVRYMADRDILPEHMAALELPDLDVVMEPVF